LHLAAHLRVPVADSPSGISLKNASAFPFANATFANRRKSEKGEECGINGFCGGGKV